MTAENILILIPKEGGEGGLYKYSKNLYEDCQNFIYYDEIGLKKTLKKISEKDPDVIEMQYDPIFFGRNQLESFFKNIKFFLRLRNLHDNLGFKLILTIHEVPKPNIKRRIFYSSLFRVINSFAFKILTLTKLAEKNFNSYSGSKKKTFHYPHPTYDLPKVNQKHFPELKKYFHKERKTILIPGIIRRNKGIIEFLKGAKHSLNKRNLKVLIAGKSKDDDYISQIKQLISSNLEGVVEIIEKFLSKEELTFLLKNSDLVVLPYKEITQSGILNYCFSVQKPVLTSNLDYFKDFEEEGLLITYKNFDRDFQEKLSLLLDKPNKILKNQKSYAEENSFKKALDMHKMWWTGENL